MPTPTALQRLQRAAVESFDLRVRVEFPVKRVSVKGSLRHHVHEYPHAPGGAFENLGRKLYEVHMTCPFMETFELYPDLWPDGLDQLRDLFETGSVIKVTIPSIGTIDARCVNWTQTMEAKIQSGEEVELEFVEDQSQLFLIDALIRENRGAIGSAFDDYITSLDEAVALSLANGPDANTFISGSTKSVFDLIRDAANTVFAMVDQIEAFGNLIESKILGLQAIIDEADADLEFLKHPENWRLWTAMRDLWMSSQKLLDDILDKRSPIATFTVPMTMSVADVSSAIYGDNTHAVDLLQINNIDDAFAVPAGFSVRYYPAAA